MRLTKLKEHDFFKFPGDINNLLCPKSKNDKYMATVFKMAGEICTIVDQLYFSSKLLGGYRKDNVAKMSRYEHIIYALENFYLRITSLYDRALRLINEVFKLGLEPRDCRRSTIQNNRNVKGFSDVYHALVAIDNFCTRYSQLRNTIAHHSTHHEEDLFSLGAVGNFPDDKKKQFESFTKQQGDGFIMNKKVELTEAIKNVETLSENLLSSLETVTNNYYFGT